MACTSATRAPGGPRRWLGRLVDEGVVVLKFFLHINLAEAARGLGLGRKLMQACLDQMTELGIPFDVTLTARDELGRLVTNFPGPVELSAWTGAAPEMGLEHAGIPTLAALVEACRSGWYMGNTRAGFAWNVPGVTAFSK